MMSSQLSILLPVDGSENSDRAVRLLVSLYEKLKPMEVRVLHVLTPTAVDDDKLSGREPAGRDAAGEGRDALRSAETLLDDAGIPYTGEIRRGHVPQEIVNYAREANCSAIIMGTKGMRTTDQILGSIVRQVIALTPLPVTLVK